MAQRRSQLRVSLRASTLDGTCHAAMVGFGETFFPAFALLLAGSPFQVGLLTTVPVLVGSGFQLLSPLGAAWTGNKAWVVASAVLQASTFAPIAMLAWSGPEAYGWLLVYVSIYWVLALGINPQWNAWMGHMIPARIRSRYFGRRNIPVHLVLFLSVVAGGTILHAAELSALGAAAGFVAVFALAAASRLMSAWFLSRQHDPGPQTADDTLPLHEVVRGFRDKPYGKLVRLLVLMTGAVHLSSAYFTPFMLQKLGLSYAQFTMLTGTLVMARVLSSTYWGDIARVFGNRRALQVAAVLLVPLPGLWLVSTNFGYLFVLQLFAGFAWAGFDLATILNFFDCTDHRDRARVLSLFNLLNGCAVVVGSLVGGLVLRTIGDGGYLWVFAGSSVMRAATVARFGRGVGARRAVEHSFQDVFIRVMGVRAGQGQDVRPLVMGDDARRRK
jgi:MFS family permease